MVTYDLYDNQDRHGQQHSNKAQIHDQKEIEMMTADLVQPPASSHPEQLRIWIDLSVNSRTDYLRGDPIT